MQNLALNWQQSAEVAGALAVIGAALRYAPTRPAATAPNRPAPTSRLRIAATFVFEAVVIAVLYSVWQFAGNFSVMGAQDAYHRGEWIARFEHSWHLPSERSVQNLVLGHSWIVQTENLYYASMHFGVMFLFLAWLFVRHRDHYSGVRWTMALTTLVCLVIQLIPVAPPRLLPGYIDTASQYGQSVYNVGLGADSISAMPSVHVAWAVLVGWYVVRISPSRWRWIAPVHSVVTVFVVVSTGNHWWLDGIVGIAVLIVCAWVRFGLSTAWAKVRTHPAAAEEPAEEPVSVS